MVKIKSIKKVKYKGYIYDITLKNKKLPYFYANDILSHNSLYPHIMIQANLFSTKCMCCDINEKWNGNDMFKIKGKYCNKKLGVIEKTIQNLYNKRKEYKAIKDPREYVIKIVINTLYGITANPAFKNVYNKTTAQDCTLIGRQSIKYAKKIFEQYGYKVLYGDTDSVYLKDEFNDKNRILKVKNKIINDIKANLPFPSDTFDMGVDEEIKHIWFFKKNNKFLKKNYIYVNKNNKVVVKGHPMVKRDGSVIGYKIFNKYFKKQIINGILLFNYRHIKDLLKVELENNLSSIYRRFKVYDADSYKLPSQLQAQISLKYGAGVHYLIANKKIGVGKSVKYCTPEEFKLNNLTIDDLDLRKFWSEMRTFCNDIPEVVKKVRVKDNKGRSVRVNRRKVNPKQSPLFNFCKLD